MTPARNLIPFDREVLCLRHFEQLSNAEAAQVLGIGESAACNRYVRALKRIGKILQGVSGWLDRPVDAPRPESIRRQMYGRAGFVQLRARVLNAA